MIKVCFSFSSQEHGGVPGSVLHHCMLPACGAAPVGTTKRAMENPELVLKTALGSHVSITSILSKTRGHGQKLNPVPEGPEEGKQDYCLIFSLLYRVTSDGNSNVFNLKFFQ